MTEDFITNRIKLIAGSKIKFANNMRLSRPTLDDYIQKTIKNKHLPRLDYAFAFEKIFDVNISIDKAKEEYNRAKEKFSKERKAINLEIEILGVITLFERKYRIKDNKILERLKAFIEQYYGGI